MQRAKDLKTFTCTSKMSQQDKPTEREKKIDRTFTMETTLEGREGRDVSKTKFGSQTQYPE